MSLSDRIVVMNKGRIEQVAVPADVYRRPSSIFVADFIGRANFIDAEAEPAGGSTVSVEALGSVRRIAAHPDVRPDQAVTLLVRPESVLVERAGGDSTEIGADRGRVLNEVFYGPWVEYDIETEVGNVTAVVYDPLAEDILEPGSMVTVSFREDRAWVLPAG